MSAWVKNQSDSDFSESFPPPIFLLGWRVAAD